jgi:hypothetical protein
MQGLMEANRNLALICTSLIERLQPAPQKAQDPPSDEWIDPFRE